MKKKARFGELESQILAKLAELRQATVSDVQKSLAEEKAYTTIMTVLNRMVSKGLLKKIKVRRSFVYRLASPQSEIRAHLFQKMKKLFFHIQPSDLLCHFLDNDQMTNEEWERLEMLMKKRKKQ